LIGWAASLVLATPVAALDIAITDNGSGSSNEVLTSVTQESTVSQSNDTQVVNEVAVENVTGGNEASGNGGEVVITTGDITTDIDVHTAVNNSVVDQSCCQQATGTAITIAGNGTDSTNEVAVDQTQTTLVSVTNTATVVNKINGLAVTGRNEANDNDGSVLIDTGNIMGHVSVSSFANHSSVSMGQNGKGDLIVKVLGNGTGSNNTITYRDDSHTDVFVTSTVDILNQLAFELITGENVANDNMGDVLIKTGDIALIADVENKTNDSYIDLPCCDEEPEDPGDPPASPTDPPVTPPPPPPPTINPNTHPNDDPGDGNDEDNDDGEVLGIGGAILPATGTLDTLLMLLASIAFLMLGSYLRLRSGRSPSRV
jgi:hypothetical protein